MVATNTVKSVYKTFISPCMFPQTLECFHTSFYMLNVFVCCVCVQANMAHVLCQS